MPETETDSRSDGRGGGGGAGGGRGEAGRWGGSFTSASLIQSLTGGGAQREEGGGEVPL